MAKELLRKIILRPYREGCGPVFGLTLWSEGIHLGGRDYLSYRLVQLEGDSSRTIFRGHDFGPSPLHAWDSDATVGGLLCFLTLRPGDTDSEYFDSYTPRQKDFAAQHAEALSCFVARFER